MKKRSLKSRIKLFRKKTKTYHWFIRDILGAIKISFYIASSVFVLSILLGHNPTMFGFEMTFIFVFLIKTAQVILLLLIKRLIKDILFKEFLDILESNVRKKINGELIDEDRITTRIAVNNALENSSVKMWKMFAWIIAWTMSIHIQSEQKYTSKKIQISLWFVGWFGKDLLRNRK